jgi:protein-L-isoaspartate(D-aspartate) O-methyltransferase
VSNGRFTRAELAVVRRAYAKQISSAADIAHPGVEAAFAAVPRERFLGPGPWKVMRWGGPNGGRYVETPGDDPVYVYTNDVIAIDPARRLNNGEPGLHALLMSRLDLRPGQHAVHIGVGAGYYTALLAEQVGPSGRVTAIEFAPDLAALAARNLAH